MENEKKFLEETIIKLENDKKIYKHINTNLEK